MIFVDYSPVLISCAHSAVASMKKSPPDDPNVTEASIHHFRMLNTLRMVNVAYRKKYGKMVICVDRKPYWRSREFPNYKKNRKPMDRTMDWKQFFDNGEDILDACKNVFGWKVIDLPGIEADDSIGVLVHEFADRGPHMIVSPDGDYKQLQIHKGVNQYDVIRRKEIVEKNPEKWLRLKIITGDKKDGIPNIVSDVNTFMTEGARQSSIKNADKKSWSSAENPLFFCNQEMLERYQFNQLMLDMSKVPEDIKATIIEEYRKPPENPGNMYSYFAGHGIIRFLDQMGDFKS